MDDYTNSCEAVKMRSPNFVRLSTFSGSSQESTLKELSSTSIFNFKQILVQKNLCEYKEWLVSTVTQKF